MTGLCTENLALEANFSCTNRNKKRHFSYAKAPGCWRADRLKASARRRICDDAPRGSWEACEALLRDPDHDPQTVARSASAGAPHRKTGSACAPSAFRPESRGRLRAESVPVRVGFLIGVGSAFAPVRRPGSRRRSRNGSSGSFAGRFPGGAATFRQRSSGFGPCLRLCRALRDRRPGPPGLGLEDRLSVGSVHRRAVDLLGESRGARSAKARAESFTFDSRGRGAKAVC